MKSLLTLLLTLAVIGTARAQQVNDGVPLQQGFCTIGTNYAFGTFTNTTPVSVLTVQVDWALYHTIHFYGATNFSYVIDRSLDNTNWFLGATNAVAAGGIAEATITGKENYLRFRVQGTNLVGGINYLGGR